MWINSLSKCTYNLQLAILIFYIFPSSYSITWLGLSRYYRSPDRELTRFSGTECTLISSNFGLKRRQLKFCYNTRNSYAMHAVFIASKAAIHYCMKTFHDRRWNCTSAENLPILGKDLELGTPQQAVVYAFSTASLLFEIARRCSRSQIRHCPCGSYTTNSTNTQMYSGCPDNIESAIRYVRAFTGYHRMGRRRRKRKKKRIRKPKSSNYRTKDGQWVILTDTRQMTNDQWQKRLKKKLKKVNAHNYEAGIYIQINNVRNHCKCHGVSGSCTYKICIRQLRRIDDERLLSDLRTNYLSAKYVELDSKSKLEVVDIFEGKSRRSLFKTELAFVDHSPDYCEPDVAVGSFGTHGRECKIGEQVNRNQTIHCSSMCCGRGYRSAMTRRKVQCGCRIEHDFRVACDSCYETLRLHYCL